MKNDRVVFIDRDGVINVDLIGDYIKTWDEFRFHEGVLEGLKKLTDSGFKIILVSNQAGIGDKVYPEKQLWEVHEKMLAEMKKAGIKIHASYYCLHGKNEGCGCRKPQTGLFLQAEKNGVRFDKSKTFFIGDKVSDVEAGKNYGLQTLLVRTGYGKKDEAHCTGRLAPEAVVDNFVQAADYVLCE